MSLPTALLRTVELSFFGEQHETSEFEKQRQIALNAINYAGNLGVIVSHLQVNKAREVDNSEISPESHPLTELSDALFVVGELQTALMDTAYAAVEEAFDALKESKT